MLLLSLLVALATHSCTIRPSRAYVIPTLPSFGSGASSRYRRRVPSALQSSIIGSDDETAEMNDGTIDGATKEERRLLENAFARGKEVLTSGTMNDADARRDTDIRKSTDGFVEQYDDEEQEEDEQRGDNLLPTSGVSVAEVIDSTLQDTFSTVLVPVKGLSGVAQIVTDPDHKSFEHVRYLVALTPPPKPRGAQEIDGDYEGVPMEFVALESEDDEDEPVDTIPYALVDLPPFSEKLLATMKAYMGKSGYLSSILMTSKDGIHYNEAPGTFSFRNNDIGKWREAFPDAILTGYRLDIPRKSRHFFTHVLDGYGPWTLDESLPTNLTFVESGKPLHKSIMKKEELDALLAKMEEEVEDDDDDEVSVPDEDDEFSPAAIRKKEEGKRVIALFTPGHTYGSVSYVFPEMDLIASGFTIPVEDNNPEDPYGQRSPMFDVRGYISTVTGCMIRQMESAKHVIETYGDRFSIILPSRTDPLFLRDYPEKMRKRMLIELMDQYEEIGIIYQKLGINNDDDEEDDDDDVYAESSSDLHP